MALKLVIGPILVLALLGGGYIIWHDYPLAYCFAAPYFAQVYMAWGTVVLYGIAAYTLYGLLFSRLKAALMGGMAGIAVIELPRLAYYLFNMGVSCG